MSNQAEERLVVQARVLGAERTRKKRRMKEKEYAIEVILSDESQYTTYRSIKEIANLHSRVMSRFPVEAGYFSKSERVIPECPLKQTIFGPSRTINNDAAFERQLNSYIKALPGLPASIVKSSMVREFFRLRASDFVVPKKNSRGTLERKLRKKQCSTGSAADECSITRPVTFKSYYAVAAYSDPTSDFGFPEAAAVQVIQKDPGGWWMVEYCEKIGWAPASFLVPVDGDLQEEAHTQTSGVGSRHISMSSYQASRDDELSFVKGAVVRVIKKYVDGWWLVRYNGGEGLVPGTLFRKFDRRQSSIYVKGIRRMYKRNSSTTIIPTMKPRWMPKHEDTIAEGPEEGNKPSLYHVLESYRGSTDSNRGEMELKKGTVVKVLSRKEHGWWYVQDQHGRRGWAPATYLKPTSKAHSQKRIVCGPHIVVQSHMAEQDDELSVDRETAVTVIWAADDGWWMVRNKVTQEEGLVPSVCLKKVDSEDTCDLETLEECRDESGYREEGRKNGDDNEIHEDKGYNVEEYLDQDLDATDGDIAVDEGYVVSVDYTAQVIDELDVCEGQLVRVIDGTEEDYWYVYVDGKEGWLPSNVLRMMTDEELDTSYSHDTSDEESDQTSSGARLSVATGQSSPRTSRGRLSPGIHRKLDRSRSDQVYTRMVKQDAIRRGSDGGIYRRPGVDFKREVPALPPGTKSGQSMPATTTGQLTPGAHRHLKRSSSPQPIRRVREEHFRTRRGSEPLTPTVMVGNMTLDELEQEAVEAERLALEAQRRASELRELAQQVRGKTGTMN